MAVDQSLLQKVKTFLRISHGMLDEELGDSIQACLADLAICGIIVPVAQDPQQTDPLILNAIKLYCRAQYTDDSAKTEGFRQRYESQKACLMISGKYNGRASDE